MRTVARLLGVASLLWGLMLVFEPSAVPAVPWLSSGVTYLGVVYCGLLALGLAVVVGSRRLRTRGERARPGGGTDRREPTVPGADLDRAVRDGDEGAVRERLREAAIATLVSQGIRDGDAEDRVTQGSWTDDAVAASFLGSAAVRPPWRYRLLATVRPGSSLERRVRRTVAALERRREGGGDG